MTLLIIEKTPTTINMASDRNVARGNRVTHQVCKLHSLKDGFYGTVGDRIHFFPQTIHDILSLKLALQIDIDFYCFDRKRKEVLRVRKDEENPAITFEPLEDQLIVGLGAETAQGMWDAFSHIYDNTFLPALTFQEKVRKIFFLIHPSYPLISAEFDFYEESWDE